MNRHTSTHRPSPQRKKKSGFTVLPLLLAALSLSLWPRAHRNTSDKMDEQSEEQPYGDQTASVQQSKTESSSSNENTEQEDASASSPIPMNHLEGVLVWVQKRIWPLSASTLSLSALSLFLYSWLFHAPINITSPSMIAALPVIFALTIVLEIFLALLVLAPTLLLSLSLDDVQKIPSSELSGQQGLQFFYRWLGSSILTVILSMAIVFGGSLWLHFSMRFLTWSTIAICTLLHMVLTLKWNLRSFSAQAKPNTPPSSKLGKIYSLTSYWLNVIISAALQALWCFSTVLIVASMIFRWEAHFFWQLLVIAFVSIWIVFFMVFFQIVTMKIAVNKKFYEDLKSQKTISTFCLGILFILAAFAGAYCIDAIFRQTASGGRKCVQLTWVQDTATGVPSVPSALVNPDNTAISQPLRILLQADGDYQIELIGDTSKTVYFVPRTRVAALASCPSTAAQKVQE